MNWYKLQDEHLIDSPALLIYPDRIRQNIALLISMIDDTDRLRPHIKTHKTREIVEMQLAQGIRKFKCATIAEAALLGQAGAPDVLLAFPLYGPKLTRFLDLVDQYPQTTFSAIVDHMDGLREMANRAHQRHRTIAVYIDVNIGMGRTGARPDGGALHLYQVAADLPGISVQGLHAYDGHVREVDLDKRKAICDKNFQPIAAIVDEIIARGLPKPRIIIGGSPSFPIYAQYPEVECSPGTFILWDKGYGDSLPEQQFLPAAVLMTRVVSMPSPNTICVDLGYKAVASENVLDHRVYFLDAPHLKPISHSEEHLLLDAGHDHAFRVGDVLYALPIHICPTVALYDKLRIVNDRAVVAEWAVEARKR